MSISSASSFAAAMADAHDIMQTQEYADQQAAQQASTANYLYNDAMNMTIRYFSMSANELTNVYNSATPMQRQVPIGFLGTRVAEFVAAWEAQGYTVTTDSTHVTIACP